MKSAQSWNVLVSECHRLDNKPYPAYKDLKGKYEDNTLGTLELVYVQGDPFASPSRVEVAVPRQLCGFDDSIDSTPQRRIAFEDFILRRLYDTCRDFRQNKGTGKGGLLETARPSQAILQRSGVRLTEDSLLLRFRLGLPARGRRIMGHAAADIFDEVIPDMIQQVSFAKNINLRELQEQMDYFEDAEFIRSQLIENKLAAFVANGSILPRKSGVEDLPMEKNTAVPFEAPDELRHTFQCPHRGEITGMGIPEGVTLIVGGGYHGKSTLLKALEAGIFNHIPGDGREFVITRRNASKIRAEDGRSIVGVNLRPFMEDLPGDVNTGSFSSDNASGSTSQAANIMEAIEAGSDCLMIDEDTAATNLMIRDERMQLLVAKDHEPITPLIDRIQQLSLQAGISTILVIGGSGDYFDVADRVIGMDYYRPVDLTKQAREIADEHPTHRRPEAKGDISSDLNNRYLDAAYIDTSRGRKSIKVRTFDTRAIQIGSQEIALDRVEQLFENGQLNTIVRWIVELASNNQKIAMRELANQINSTHAKKTPDPLIRSAEDGLSEVRGIDVVCAINRLRNLRLSP